MSSLPSFLSPSPNLSLPPRGAGDSGFPRCLAASQRSLRRAQPAPLYSSLAAEGGPKRLNAEPREEWEDGERREDRAAAPGELLSGQEGASPSALTKQESSEPPPRKGLGWSPPTQGGERWGSS